MQYNIKNYHLNTNIANKVRIICFYHAGGYASQYNVWGKFLPAEIECVVYERPGCGSRASESPSDNWSALVNDTWMQLKSYLDLPYIIFGHSLGASLGFEFGKLLQLKEVRQPKALFIADRKNPMHIPKQNRHSLPKEQFIKMLVDTYNLDSEISENDEIMEIFLPILRSEFKLADNYHIYHQQNSRLLKFPIISLRPESNPDEIFEHILWKEFTNEEFKLHHMPGDHFFNFKYSLETLNYLVDIFGLSCRTNV